MKNLQTNKGSAMGNIRPQLTQDPLSGAVPSDEREHGNFYARLQLAEETSAAVAARLVSLLARIRAENVAHDKAELPEHFVPFLKIPDNVIASAQVGLRALEAIELELGI